MTNRKFQRILAASLLSLAVAVAGCSQNDSASYVASAKGYLAKADYRAAIIELKNALRQSPNDPQARFLLAKALQDGGNPVAAETEFRKAIELKYSPDEAYPLLARALSQRGASSKELAELATAPVQEKHAKAELATALGTGYLGLGHVKEAQLAVESALALEPASVNSRVLQARISAVAKNYAASIAQVDEVLKEAPDHVEALMLKADLESLQGQRAAANALYERIVVLRPGTARVRFALINGYFALNQLDRAKVALDAVKKIAPKDARTLHAEAYLAYAQNDLATALAAVQKSIQAAPDFLPAQYLSGLINYKRGAFGAAEQSLRTVVAKAPEDERARTALAETYLRMGQPMRAQETLEPVLKRASENPQVLRLAGEIQLSRKDPARSAEFISRANALEKDNVSGRVRLAEVRFAQGDTGPAVKELEELAATVPDSRDADIALITVHLRARDYDKALAAADALVKKQPTSAAAQNMRGVVFMIRGDNKNARSAFEKALALDPKFSTGEYNLARIDVAERKFADAQKRYEKLVERGPKAESALLGLAELKIVAKAPAAEVNAALQRAIAANPNAIAPRLLIINYNALQKDWRTAIAAAQAALASIPDSPKIVEELAKLHQAADEPDQALDMYRRLAKLQPENSLPLIRIAGIQMKQKSYTGAIASLRAAMVLAPDNPTIWVGLGAAYAGAGQFDAGFAEARRLQKAQTGKPMGWALEGELLMAQKKTPEAIVAYQAALARRPVPFTAIRLHSLLLAAGKTDEAANFGQKWLKAHPKDVAVHAYLAQRSLAKRDYKAAAPLFRAAVENAPDNVLILNNLAWSLSELNDPKALEYAERALKLAPGSPEVVNTYGWILVKQGDTARGIEFLRRAVELEPNDSGKRLRLAQALIKSGDKTGARKELELVVKADDVSARDQASALLKTL